MFAKQNQYHQEDTLISVHILVVTAQWARTSGHCRRNSNLHDMEGDL